MILESSFTILALAKILNYDSKHRQ
jgi:hypothetical protein